MPDFQSIYDRIREATGSRTQSEVATLLGVKQSSISDALRRQSIPDQWLLTLFDTCALNPAWVRSGKGPRYVTGSDGQPPIPLTLECTRRLEPVLKAALMATVPTLAEKLREALCLPVPEEAGGPEEENHDAL